MGRQKNKWARKGDLNDPSWFTHLGNLFSSTKLQKLITFLAETRRPRDLLEVARLKI